MNFTTDTWKNRAKEKYAQLKQLISYQTHNAGFVAYGALTTLTLWPLVEYVSAAAQPGQPLPIAGIMALGSVAGGVGGNLLASQIQVWYDAAARGEAPDETAVLNWLQTNAVTNETVREAVDKMLEALEAVPNAQEAMSASDWQTLGQQLVQELGRLGNLTRYEATLIGSGIIVKGDNNIVLGAGAVHVGGNVGGDVVTGTKIEQILDPDKTDPQALRRAYLSRKFVESNQLLLGGIDPKATIEASDQLKLSAVYTALLTETSEEGAHFPDIGRLETAMAGDKHRLSALEQLNQHRHLVLLGDPGSGKSTFVNFVALCLSGELLGEKQVNLALLTAPLPPDEDEARRQDEEKEGPKPQIWDHGALLPVNIVLRDLAAGGLPPSGQPATAAHLWRFLQAELEAASLGEYAPLLRKELMEKGGIFLFDGLDEVPTADQHRLHIKQLVEDVGRTYPNCRILVTSRTYAYQKQDWRLPAFNETVLARFSWGQIELFVERWYAHIGGVRHLGKQDAQGKAALLKLAIFNNSRLYALAERPLLLTLMASLHAWRGGSLPEKREQLYSDSVDLLLDVWEKQRIVRDANGQVRIIQPSLEQWLKADRDKVRGLLNRLAFEAHSKQTDLVGTADIAETDLVMGLLNLSEEKGLQPKHLVEFLSNRAGLLLPRGIGVYTFPHRTFQEYLAACHLTGPGYPSQVAQLARQDPNRWREVALLAGAKAAAGSNYALWGLVEELCHEAPGEGGGEAYWGAHLAGRFLVETADLSQLTPAQAIHFERLRYWLVQVLTDPVLPTFERIIAGRHLAKLGDPRPEVMNVDEMHFCLVPTGQFWFGGRGESQKVNLNYDYWVGRYPITNSQFCAFIEDGGYQEPDWWYEAHHLDSSLMVNGIMPKIWVPTRYAKHEEGNVRIWGLKTEFDSDISQFRQNNRNHPAIYINWFEAMAFTRWLTERWHKKGILPKGWSVRLPKESEWEKAARGGLKIPSEPRLYSPTKLGKVVRSDIKSQKNEFPKREYPWGDGLPDPQMLNFSETNIGATNSPGCFADNNSPYGCNDMSGNVFEWTMTEGGEATILKYDEKAAFLFGLDYETDSMSLTQQLVERGHLPNHLLQTRVIRGGSYRGGTQSALKCSDRPRWLALRIDSDLSFRIVVAPDKT